MIVQKEKRKEGKRMGKKRYENIKLFGENFILDTKETIGYKSISHDTIFDVYGRCSQRKISIWQEWKRWFNENNGWCSVHSHNCNFFTIQGYVRNFETREMYFCYITPRYNRCILVKEEEL